MSLFVRNTGIHVLSAILACCLFMLLWSWIFAHRESVIYTNPPKQPIIACSGSVVHIDRTLEFTRPLNLTISRALIQTGRDGELLTIELATRQTFRDKSIIRHSRAILIPEGTPDGIWTIKTYVTAHEPPFWDVTQQAPDIILQIGGKGAMCEKAINHKEEMIINSVIGISARCKDGMYSASRHRNGACSWHGGIDYLIEK